MPPIQLTAVPAHGPFALAVHGGAGPLNDAPGRVTAQGDGLRRALTAGQEVLAAGGPALDAVCAAVVVLEDDEAFNAGRGAALTVAGTAELDACVCDGATGRTGAVAASRYARHPVLAARAVMDRTPHVLLAGPGERWLDEVGLERVDPGWFVTPARLAALHRRTQETTAPAVGHGTVGAVARDVAGRLAAATSTVSAHPGSRCAAVGGAHPRRHGVWLRCDGDHLPWRLRLRRNSIAVAGRRPSS